jgi:proteic killer suppression protein
MSSRLYAVPICGGVRKSRIPARLPATLLDPRHLCIADYSLPPGLGVATCNRTGYAATVIVSFRHKGLELYFSTGNTAGIQASHAERLRLILGRLNVSTCPADMNLPGLRLHQLKGNRRGTWSVRVSGNWRVTFKFIGEDAADVDYEDYH